MAFEYDSNLSSNTYRPIEPYTHIFEFNHEGSRYLIKFASDSTLQYMTDDIYMKPLIQHEWDVYKQIQNLPEYDKYKKYFLEGVKGGEYKYSEINSCAYIILPYIKSESLEGFVREKLRVKDNKEVARTLCNYLEHVAYALEYLLSHGICHGDMHSGNILITDEGIKVIDFDTAGSCDQHMNLGRSNIKGRQTLRRNMNLIGYLGNTFTGFFVMCKSIFSKFNHLKPFVERIDTIVEEYLQREDVSLAYKKIISLLKSIQAQEGGRRTRRSRTRRRSIRLCSRRSSRSRSRRSRSSRIPSSK
jgi:serine/threonine protein kinase